MASVIGRRFMSFDRPNNIECLSKNTSIERLKLTVAEMSFPFLQPGNDLGLSIRIKRRIYRTDPHCPSRIGFASDFQDRSTEQLEILQVTKQKPDGIERFREVIAAGPGTNSKRCPVAVQ